MIKCKRQCSYFRIHCLRPLALIQLSFNHYRSSQRSMDWEWSHKDHIPETWDLTRSPEIPRLKQDILFTSLSEEKRSRSPFTREGTMNRLLPRPTLSPQTACLPWGWATKRGGKYSSREAVVMAEYNPIPWSASYWIDTKSEGEQPPIYC